MPQKNDRLPRRGYVGLQVAPAETGPEGRGLYVRAVAKGGAAERAGALPGDRLIAIGDSTVSDLNTVRRLLRELHTDDALRITVLRGERDLVLHDEVHPFPVEQHEGAEIVLDEVQVGEHRLRAIALLPDTPGPHPVVYYLPGAHWASEEYPFQAENPVPALLGELARQGIASLRVDRFGMGDSEGPPCQRVDFETELNGYRQGLKLLSRVPWAKPERIALFGHSLGAMVAPLLAAEHPVRCIVTFGASAIPISRALVEALHRFAALQPQFGPALREESARVAELIERIVAGGRTPEQAFAERPELKASAPAHITGDMIYRRVVSFYHQLERVDLVAAWRSLVCPVLLLHGSHDWICAASDSQRIAELVGGKHRVLPGVDHQLAAVQRPKLTLADSLRDATVEFLRAELCAAAES
jgi:uncharacterized protein